MAITADFFEINGLVALPEDISFGEGETIDVKINRNGAVTTIPIVKRTVTLSLKGIPASDLQTFQNQRDNNINGLITGSVVPQDMVINGYNVEKVVLTKVTPSGPISVQGIDLFDQVELEFSSLVYN